LSDFGDSGAQRQNIEYLALVDIADETQQVIARRRGKLVTPLDRTAVIATSLFFLMPRADVGRVDLDQYCGGHWSYSDLRQQPRKPPPHLRFGFCLLSARCP
jgi:hypothetical protein